MPAPVTPPISLGAAQARLLHVAAQGLLLKPRARATPTALQQAIANMHLLQIDTIHVVARSPYLVLFSRLGAYPQAWLDDLLANGRIAECWAHEACFVPSREYPLHRAFVGGRTNHWAQRHARRVHAANRAEMDRLLEQVRTGGPVRSSDFARTGGASSGWWEWKLEKRWLEAWFAMGELMVARRERFQRVYDLAERVRALHDDSDAPPLSAPQVRQRMVALSVQALGIAQPRWMGDYFRIGRVGAGDLQPLEESGELVRVDVRGWEAPGYVHRDRLELARRAAAGQLRATHTTVLSPFDPLVWDRARAQAMFGFAYTLECYVPAPRRRYGYFVLPILHRGRLVGRLDAKAHRGDGEFEVKAVFLEPGEAPTPTLVAALATAIGQCARWHGASRVRVGRSEPRGLAAALRKALRAGAA
jgi:uncharacterized protein YcaQ